MPSLVLATKPSAPMKGEKNAPATPETVPFAKPAAPPCLIPLYGLPIRPAAPCTIVRIAYSVPCPTPSIALRAGLLLGFALR